MLTAPKPWETRLAAPTRPPLIGLDPNQGCVFALLNSLGWWCRNTNTPGSLALSKTASPPAWNVEDKHSPIFPSS